jgi:hypothetical protein
LLFTIYMGACTTLADSVSAKGSGTKRIYDRTQEEIWPIAIEAVNDVGLSFVSSDTTKNMILAQGGMSLISYGENVAIFVESINEKQCMVEVVSKRVMTTNILAKSWALDIFNAINEKTNTKGVAPED